MSGRRIPAARIGEILAAPSVRAAVPRTRRTDRDFVTDWARRRLGRLIDAGQLSPEALSSPASPGLIARIAGELTRVRAAHETIRRRVAADTHHMSFATRQERRAIRRQAATGNPALAGDPRLFRDHSVRSIVYQATADDMGWIDLDPSLTRLHWVTDRRLRIVEVMAHQVGGLPPGASAATWPSRRLFAFPSGTETGAPAVQANAAARACWVTSGVDRYELDFTPSAPGCGLTAAEAIRKLFPPPEAGAGPNLFFCDHVMMALHLEALDFAESARDAGPGWLDPERQQQPEGVRERWLRIDAQFDNADVFLGARRERATGTNTHFDYRSVRDDHLQVGDHLIVYNHPLLRHIAQRSAWGLENCVVMQTVPTVRVQGHGSSPALTIDEMRNELLGWLVVALANVERDLAERKATGTVEEVRPGVGSAPLPAYLYVTHDDGRRVWLLRKYDPDRFPEYRGDRELAAWYVVWECEDDCYDVYSHPQRRVLVRDLQQVEFTQGEGRLLYGWFPLATIDAGTGSLSPTVLGTDSVFGWDFSADDVPEGRDHVAVIRPGVAVIRPDE